MTYPVTEDAKTKSDDVQPLSVAEESTTDSLEKTVIKGEAVESAKEDNTENEQVSVSFKHSLNIIHYLLIIELVV